jgi:hypothetical protein
MQRGNWVPIDKGFISMLPKDRPYSEVEAAFSLTCDYDEGSLATIEGYMKLWKWGKGKVYRFVKNRGFSLKRGNKRGPGVIIIDRTIGDTTSGRKADDRRTQNGRPVILDSKWLKRTADDRRTIGDTTSGRKADDRRNTTIYPNPNPNPKKQTQGETNDKPAENNPPACAGSAGDKNRTKVNGYSEKFLTFWAAYPKKHGKAPAWKKWKREGLDSIFDEIMVSLGAHKASAGWVKNNGQFIPQGSTWVNQERWEDEIQPSTGINQSKNGVIYDL